MHNADQALEAMVNPSPITIGQLALLDRCNCPLVLGEWADLDRTLLALWLLSMPVADAVAAYRDDPDGYIVWGGGLSPADYRARLKSALDGITEFYRMLPRAEAGDKKKDSATASFRSSPNGSAAPTAGRSATRSRGSRPSRPRSSGDAGARGREA